MGKEGRARLVGDSCVPKLHSSLRCHVSFHTRVHVCAYSHTHTYTRDTQARTHRHVGLDQERLLGGGASSSTPRKYSGQYIPLLLFFLLLLLLSSTSFFASLVPPFHVSASLLPFVLSSFFFRVVTSAKLRREPSQFRVVARRVNSGTLLSGKIWNARARAARTSARPPSDTFAKNLPPSCRVASRRVARILRYGGFSACFFFSFFIVLVASGYGER